MHREIYQNGAENSYQLSIQKWFLKLLLKFESKHTYNQITPSCLRNIRLDSQPVNLHLQPVNFSSYLHEKKIKQYNILTTSTSVIQLHNNF